MQKTAITLRDVFGIFKTFLRDVIHIILQQRSLYPADAFTTYKKYNTTVYECCHTGVCEWIERSVNLFEDQLQKGTLDQVVLVIRAQDDRILEQYTFDVSRFPCAPPTCLDTPTMMDDSAGDSEDVLPEGKYLDHVKAVISRFSNCSGILKALPQPQSCTWTVRGVFKHGREAPLEHPQHWIPSPPRTHDTNLESRTYTVPKINAGIMQVECFIVAKDEY